jgi:hypothetical protein
VSITAERRRQIIREILYIYSSQTTTSSLKKLSDYTYYDNFLYHSHVHRINITTSLSLSFKIAIYTTHFGALRDPNGEYCLDEDWFASPHNLSNVANLFKFSFSLTHTTLPLLLHSTFYQIYTHTHMIRHHFILSPNHHYYTLPVNSRTSQQENKTMNRSFSLTYMSTSIQIQIHKTPRIRLNTLSHPSSSLDKQLSTHFSLLIASTISFSANSLVHSSTFPTTTNRSCHTNRPVETRYA